MTVNKFTIKENSWLAKIAAKKLRASSVALVLGGTIHLHKVSKEDFLKNDKWVKHELCHVQHFNHHGFVTFIIKYLWESIKMGYHSNKYEEEARQAEIL